MSSITIRGCEWFDHATEQGGRAISFVKQFYGLSYPDAMSLLLGDNLAGRKAHIAECGSQFLDLADIS